MTDATRTPVIIPVSDLAVDDIIVATFLHGSGECFPLPSRRIVRSFSPPFEEWRRPAIRVNYTSGDWHDAITMAAQELVLVLR